MQNRVNETPTDYIVDLPQRIQHYIYLSDKKVRNKIIEHQVIDNKGNRAFELACSLFDDGENDLDANWHDNWEKFPYKYMGDSKPSLKELVLKLGPGPVSNFLLTENFIEAAKSKKSTNENVYGYWQFVSNNVDDKGEFVFLTATKAEKILKNKLDKEV